MREALELYASFYPNPADWRELLERWGLAGKADTRFAKLSGGQKQRLFIALALIGTRRWCPRRADLGLDPGARHASWDLIAQVRTAASRRAGQPLHGRGGGTCDRVAILERGRIAALDTPAGLVDRRGRDRCGSGRWRARRAVADRAPGVTRPAAAANQVDRHRHRDSPAPSREAAGTGRGERVAYRVEKRWPARLVPRVRRGSSSRDFRAFERREIGPSCRSSGSAAAPTGAQPREPPASRPRASPRGFLGIHRTVDAAGYGWPAAGRPRGAAKMAAQPIRRRGAPGEAG